MGDAAEQLSRPALDADELPDADGRVWLPNGSATIHMFERCPHIYHANAYEATPETFDRVWKQKVDRRALVSSLRWCSWCQSRYAREQLDDD